MTNPELAVLSLIAEAPKYGYEIEQIIEQRGMREWTEIGFSSIYYLLKKLEKSGLVTSQIEKVDGPGPARKVYRITPEGWQTQIDESIKALNNSRQISSPFLMGLSNFPILPKIKVIDALKSYCIHLEGRLEHINSRAEEQKPLPPFVDAMFDYSKTLVEAELNWMRKFIKDVEAGNV